MSLPRPSLPHLSLVEARELVGPAFVIAALGAIESLLSAVVADGMIGGRHRANMELVAQGVANVVAPLFGGMPATGAIARTATNVKSGGRTPVAGMVHALTLLVITLFAGRWAALIPLAALAAIVLSVAYHMSEWRVFRSELTAPKSDAIVMMVTFLVTILVDLPTGIGIGMVLASFLFMKRMAEVTNVTVVSREFDESVRGTSDDSGAIYRRDIPPGVEVYEINGPFFFGAAEKFKDTLALRLAEAEGARHPDAERPCHRLHRHACAQGPRPPHPEGRHEGPVVGRACAAAGGVEPVGADRRDRGGQLV